MQERRVIPPFLREGQGARAMSSTPDYHDTRLDGGLRVASQPMPEAESVAIGIFIDAGSRDEPAEKAGISHALEHMAFKGVRGLDVHRLAERLDELGGHANAFTTRERICFHMQVLHEDWREALTLLAGMVNEPTLPADEWRLERGVILSEIAMVADAPEEWAMDRHLEGVFPAHALGRPVLGSAETLAAIERRDLADWLDTVARPPRLLVAAAGRIEHDALVEALDSMQWRAAGEPAHRLPPQALRGGVQPLPREDEQVQLLLSMPGATAADPARCEAWLANQVLGGGMSSRLFREVREKRGLAYGVGAHLSSLSDAGLWTVFCAAAPDQAAEAAAVIADVLEEAADTLAPEELERARRQLEVQLRMGMDSVESRMLRLGGLFDEPRLASPAEWIARLRATGIEAVRRWMRERLVGPQFWTVAAPARALSAICDRIPACSHD